MQNLGKGIDEEGEVVEVPQSPEEPTRPKTLEFGRLVVDEGRSRYVSNKFWNSLSEEASYTFRKSYAFPPHCWSERFQDSMT